MKVAVVIAKFPSGWRTLAIGEDRAATRGAFKAVKVAGVLEHKGEVAEVAYYFDSGGEIMRKFLRSPDALAAIQAADADTEEKKAAADEAKANATAEAAGRAQAVAIAEKAVAAVASEVAALIAPVAVASSPVAFAPGAVAVAPKSEIPSKKPDAAQSDTAPVAPVLSGATGDASGVGTEQAEDDEGDMSARFGGKPKPTKPGKH